MISLLKKNCSSKEETSWKQWKSNKQTSEFNSLKTNLEKKEDIIERISYREIGYKINQFFYLCQPEDKIKYYEEKNISPKNINIIIKYFKTNFSFYWQYMKNNKIDLTQILKEIKKEKKFMMGYYMSEKEV